MSNLFHLYGQIVNRPLLITPEKAELIYSIMAAHGLSQTSQSSVQMIKSSNVESVVSKPYQILCSKVAVISIVGALVNRGPWIGTEWGLVSYEGIERQIKSAMADDQIEAVIFDFDSPGGDASGCLELAEQIRNLSTMKKTASFVNGQVCSAAYALASATNEIITKPSGLLGSIGVVSMHIDFSKQLEQEGIKPTFIYAGSHKVDGNQYEPISDDFRATIQKDVDALYEALLSTVAKGRGQRLTVAAARATEARIYTGQDAVKTGLADKIGTFDEILASLVSTSKYSKPTIQKGVTAMDTDDNAAAKAIEGNQRTLDANAIVASKNADKTSGEKLAYDRIGAILSSEGIAANSNRLKAALDLAIKAPTMSAEDVVMFVSNNITEEKATSSASLASRLTPPDTDIVLNAVNQSNGQANNRLKARTQKMYGGKNGTV